MLYFLAALFCIILKVASALSVKRPTYIKDQLLAGPFNLKHQTESSHYNLAVYPPIISFEFGVTEVSASVERRNNAHIYTVIFPHLREDTIGNLFSYEILDDTLLHLFIYDDLWRQNEGHGWFFELDEPPNHSSITADANQLGMDRTVRYLLQQ